jgi:hypothetical protein
VAEHPDAAVVVTDGNIGRRAWPHAVDGDEWFLTDGDDALRELSDELADEGRTLVVATLGADDTSGVLADRFDIVERVQPDPDVSRVLFTAVPR